MSHNFRLADPYNYVVNNFLLEIYNFLGLLKTAWFFFNKLNFKSLLEENIRVLIYAGDLDYICNWIGNKRNINFY
jgi:carboxypeptidase C (cathepsin A)